MFHRSRRSRRRGRGRQPHPFYDAYEIKVRPERHIWVGVLLMLWRWRIELLLIAVLWVCFHALTTGPPPVLGEPAAVAVMAAPPVVLLAVPWTRRPIIRRGWCVLTRHRLRACLVQLQTTNWDGRLPWVLWIRPTPVGERAWLLMLPGLSATDLDNHTEALAAACWARETRLHRIRRSAALVRVDVIRRDPLTKPTPITNPLLQTTADVQDTAAETQRPALTVVPDPEPTAEAAADEAPTTTGSKPEADETSVAVNGEDLSDYV